MPLLDHPSLDLLVTDEQRERSIDYLNQCYATGRLERDDLESRVERALTARTRRELNAAFDGLARIPVGTGASLVAPRSSTEPRPLSRAGAAVAHFSAFGTGMVGPGVVYALAPEKSYVRAEAAKAFNFQVVSLVALVAAHVLLPTAVGNVAMALMTMAWLLLTVMGGARAAQGSHWRNPVTTVVPLRILDEGPRPGPRRRPALGR